MQETVISNHFQTVDDRQRTIPRSAFRYSCFSYNFTSKVESVKYDYYARNSY